MTSLPLAPFVVSERSYPPVPSVDRHPFHQIVLPERGRLEMLIDGERGFAGAARFARIPAGAEHRYWANQPNGFLVLDLSPTLLAAARQDLQDPGPFPDERFPAVGERMAAFAALLRMELARGGLREPLIAEALGRYACALLLRPGPAESRSSPGERRLALRTRDALEASYQEARSVADIAADVGSSASHMQRAFRAHFGQTIVGFLQSRRLHHARELLRETDLSVTEVATASGFVSHGYFTRLFTRETGCPPSRYRAAIRAGSGR